MKYLLAAILALGVALSSTAQQYPRTVTLTVTRVTRTEKATPDCDNCISETTAEAHSATTNFVLTCKATDYLQKPENSTVCAQLETGSYEAIRVAPDWFSFWGKTPPPKATLYKVIVEEAARKQ
jgi:hypothetical protein